MNRSPVQVSGTSDAGGGLDIESARLRHDDGPPRSYLRLAQRIAGRQWVGPAALGSLQAEGQKSRNDYSQDVEFEFAFDADNTAKGNVPRLLLAVGRRPNLDKTS